MPFIKIYPREGEPWLDREEVLRRVRAVFEQVDVDEEAGRASLAKMLRTLQSFESAPPESIARLQADLAEAATITAWNGECDPANGMQFDWRPREMLYIRYEKGSRRHATTLRKALGYDFEEV
jgi:hypothetical protein